MLKMMMHLVGNQTLDADKEDCFKSVRRMIDLVKFARMNGILSLEAEIDEEEDIFIKTGLELVIDGVDPETVDNILSNMILAGGYSGTELLRKIVLAQGITCVQMGDNPGISALRMAALLGEQYMQRASEAAKLSMSADEYMAALKGRETIPECKAFEEQLTRFYFYAVGLYRILKEMDTFTIAHAIQGCSTELIWKVRCVVSKNTFAEICNQIVSTGLHIETTLYAQGVIMAKAQALRDSGQILFPEDYFIRDVLA